MASTRPVCGSIATMAPLISGIWRSPIALGRIVLAGGILGHRLDGDHVAHRQGIARLADRRRPYCGWWDRHGAPRSARPAGSGLRCRRPGRSWRSWRRCSAPPPASSHRDRPAAVRRPASAANCLTRRSWRSARASHGPGRSSPARHAAPCRRWPAAADRGWCAPSARPCRAHPRRSGRPARGAPPRRNNRRVTVSVGPRGLSFSGSAVAASASAAVM